MISSRSHSHRTASFRILSCRRVLVSHLMHPWSKLSSLRSSSHLTHKASHPYRSSVRTVALYTLTFVWREISRLRHRGLLNCMNALRAAAIRDAISSLDCPFADIIAPRYLKCPTSSISSPFSLISRSFGSLLTPDVTVLVLPTFTFIPHSFSRLSLCSLPLFVVRLGC